MQKETIIIVLNPYRFASEGSAKILLEKLGKGFEITRADVCDDKIVYILERLTSE